MKTRHVFAGLFLSGVLLTACSSDNQTIEDDQPGQPDQPTATEQFAIMATDSENTYILTQTEIGEGSIAPNSKNSIQVIGTPSWYFADDLAAYGFVYRQGDPGTTQSFILDEEGQLKDRNEIDLTVSIQSKAYINGQIYVEYSSRNYEEPIATFYKIDPETEGVTGPITINTDNLADNGEYAYFTNIQEVNGKILMAFRTIKAGSDGNDDDLFASDYNDHTYIAVYSEILESEKVTLNLEKVITDTGRTGLIAGQFRGGADTGIEKTEDGSVYAFASALDGDGVPSGILKLDTDQMDFDADYFFNISEASGGYKLYRSYYVGGDTFVLQMFTEPETASASPNDTRNKFAVVNVANQSFEWVDNIPEGIIALGEPYADTEKGQFLIPIETSGYPTIYILDANTAHMTPGIEVKAEGVNAIGKLKIHN